MYREAKVLPNTWVAIAFPMFREAIKKLLLVTFVIYLFIFFFFSDLIFSLFKEK